MHSYSTLISISFSFCQWTGMLSTLTIITLHVILSVSWQKPAIVDQIWYLFWQNQNICWPYYYNENKCPCIYQIKIQVCIPTLTRLTSNVPWPHTARTNQSKGPVDPFSGARNSLMYSQSHSLFPFYLFHKALIWSWFTFITFVQFLAVTRVTSNCSDLPSLLPD